MNKILLKSVTCNGSVTDIYIEGNRFKKITSNIPPEETEGAEIVDCRYYAIFPAFYNTHTHAAMTYLRGFADDMPLFKWLNEYIWPFEAKVTGDDIEIASRLALLEMIKSGTVFFADMYWEQERTLKVVEEMGLRATIGVTFADTLLTPEKIEAGFNFLRNRDNLPERIQVGVMPHSIYTVGEKLFRRCVNFAKEEGLVLQTHLSETEKEVADCHREYGCTPVELVEKFGAFDNRFVAAHCVHFSDNDFQIFAQAGATVALNPCSNLKLSSGIVDIPTMLKHNIKLSLGTDGTSSNNNLDMHEEMKFASFLAKVKGSAETLPAEQILQIATEAGAKAFGIEDAGRIEEGWLADALLVDLSNERMNPRHNILSNWVYSADSSAIDSVICNGRFLMRHRHVDGEEDIIREANECALRINLNK